MAPKHRDGDGYACKREFAIWKNFPGLYMRIGRGKFQGLNGDVILLLQVGLSMRMYDIYVATWLDIISRF